MFNTKSDHSFGQRLAQWFAAMDEVVHQPDGGCHSAILEDQSSRIARLEAELAKLKNGSQSHGSD